MSDDRPNFSMAQQVAVAGFVLGAAAMPISGLAQTQTVTVPSDTVLFSSPEMLETWLELDLERLLADIGDDRAEHLGRWSYLSEDGSTVEMPIFVRTRGNSRRQPEVCSFPPLRFRFREDQVGNTLFAGQDRLKLVTHCRTEVREYQQYLLEEYLLYHVYQMVSDRSFQVRLARVTYNDRRQNLQRIMRAGFFLEDKDAMAARLGGTIVKRGERAGELDAATTATLEVFQYLIGNVEWNLDDHDNIEVVDIGGTYYPVPVDFDVAGVIAPPYAEANEALGVRRVGDRVFRGACRPRDELDAALGLFAERKDDIYALYRSFPLLEDDRRERTLAYFDDFFDIIGDNQRVEREFTARCP
jgi:hypothetical protein